MLPTHLWLMHYPCMCALTNGFHQPVHSASSVFPTKAHMRSKQSSNAPSPKNFLTICGCFEHYMYHILALSWSKKKKKKKKKKKINNSDFWLFQACHFKYLLHVAITTANWGKFYKPLNQCTHDHLLFGNDITV